MADRCRWGVKLSEKYLPSKLGQSPFENAYRVKVPAEETSLEKSNAPVIAAPEKVTAGEPFTVEVSVEKGVYPMGQAHWIELIDLKLGNEAGDRLDFQSRGYRDPKATFTVVLANEAAPAGKVTLVVHQRCNLHGYRESTKDVPDAYTLAFELVLPLP